MAQIRKNFQILDIKKKFSSVFWFQFMFQLSILMVQSNL